MDVYKKLEELNIQLRDKTKLGGIYTPVMEFGDKLIYTSGVGGASNDDPGMTGKLGADLTLEQGQEMARGCAVNLLSNLHHQLGDLNKIRRFVKMLAFVASADDFYSQPQVANGASQLIRDVFGEQAGLPARSAIGVNVLPGNIPVEIEVLVELY